MDAQLPKIFEISDEKGLSQCEDINKRDYEQMVKLYIQRKEILLDRNKFMEAMEELKRIESRCTMNASDQIKHDNQAISFWWPGWFPFLFRGFPESDDDPVLHSQLDAANKLD